MPIKLAITGQPAIEIDVENITIGSDRSCTVTLDDATVMPKHAVIRKIAGRWLIEVREAPAVFVGGPPGPTESKRLHWLLPGDQIRLTENGPAITFEPSNSDSLPLKQSGSVSRSFDDFMNEVIFESEKEASLTVTSTKREKSSSGSKPIATGTQPPSHSIRSSDAGMQHSKSAINPAALEAGSQPSIAQQPDPSSDEPPKSGPVLTRIPWSDGNSLTGDEFPNNDALTADQAEIRWVMTVVFRSVAAGVAVLVVWLIVSALVKSF